MTTALVLPCPAALAASLALPGGLPADDLHVTLAVVEGEVPVEALAPVLATLAGRFPPLGAVLSGVGRFSGETLDAVHLCVDAQGLLALRVAALEALAAAGLHLDTKHGFDPHMTLAYVAHEAPTPLVRLEPTAVRFDRLAAWAGDARSSLPFAGPTALARTAPRGARIASPVELSAMPVDDAGAGTWNVLAYEVELKASGIVLARADFEACVRNFAAYPKVPIVIEHADTHGGPAEWAEPHGWVAALRVGAFTRPDGRVVAALEGLLQPDPATRDAMRSTPERPAKWPFGSVTLFAGHDEERDAPLGMCLWSFSLTAHPRLVDVPRLAASLDHAPAPASPETTTMSKFIALAAVLGLAAKSDDEAHAHLEAFTARTRAEARATREALRLSADAPHAEVLGAVTTLSTAAAKVPALETQVAAFEKAEAERFARDLQAHVDAYIAAGGPEREEARAALEAFARADYAAFSAKYPKPSQAERRERAQDASRFASLPGSKKGASAPAPQERADVSSRDVIAAAHTLVERSGGELAFSEALSMLSEDPLDDAPRAELDDDAR